MSQHTARIASLYQRHFAELVAFLSHRVASRELATDLVQELFVRLLARRDLVDGVQHERGYLFKSVRHLATEATRLPRWREGAEESGDDAGEDIAECDNRQPEAVVADRQTIARLLKVVGRLPPRCREAFVLHKFEHLSYAEVAARMGISQGAVEKHVARALSVCRDEIGRPGR